MSFAAGTRIVKSATGKSSTSMAAVNALDNDLKLSLLPHQIKYCSEALKFLKNKRVYQSELLDAEFASLPQRVKVIVMSLSFGFLIIGFYSCVVIDYWLQVISLSVWIS